MIFSSLGLLIAVLIFSDALSRHGILSQGPPKLNPFAFPPELNIGSRAKVLCTVYLGDPPLEFNWLKDGNNLSSGKVQQLNEQTSELLLSPLNLQHIGNYTCVVKNAAGSDSYTASLFVTAPPKWIKEPNDTRVIVGSKVALDCQANGSPHVKITWKRRSASLGDLVHVEPSRNLQILPNNSLVITNAQKSQAGTYVCEASNGIGDGLSRVIQLDIYEIPVVQRLVDHVTVEHGQDTLLSCIVRGDGPLILLWRKNGQIVSDWTSDTDRVLFSEEPESTGTRFMLRIARTELEDEGLYVCSAKNDFGSDEKDIRLLLVERPRPPNDVEVVDIWSRSSRIRWTAPSNGNSPILGYTIEYWSLAGGHQNLSIRSSPTSVILRGLNPATSYHFHIWAGNSVGLSDPSEQMQFITAKEEPSAPPTDVHIEEIGSTFIRLSWKPPPQQDWNGGLRGYYVGYKQSSSLQPFTYNTIEHEDDETYYVLRGLQRSIRYLVMVKAYNEIGSGPPSEEISFRTLNQESPPKPSMMVKSIGSSHLQLQWFVQDEFKSQITGYTIHYRRNNNKWNEISMPEPSQTSFTLTNLEVDETYQVFIIAHSSFGSSEPSEMATIRTSVEPLIQAAPVPPVQSASDDVTQTLYIVIPVAVATVIIVIVVVGACLYVYSKRPIPTPLSYSDYSADKNFSYMATAPRRRDPSIPLCGDGIKQHSPYSTVPLTRHDIEEEEPIYESVVEEIRSKIKQRAFEDEKKLQAGTIV